MKLDVMPAEEKVLGFSNSWYALALRTAVRMTLPAGPAIRLIAPVCFLATKLEAFEDRGRRDYLESHDFEDVLSVVDGRREIVAEFARAEPAARRHVAAVFRRLLADQGFLNALPGIVVDGSPATRVALVIERLRSIVATDQP